MSAVGFLEKEKAAEYGRGYNIGVAERQGQKETITRLEEEAFQKDRINDASIRKIDEMQEVSLSEYKRGFAAGEEYERLKITANAVVMPEKHDAKGKFVSTKKAAPPKESRKARAVKSKP